MAWRRVDVPGHDECSLWRMADGWRLLGTAVFTLDDEQCQLSYVVECDSVWMTRAATVEGWRGREALSIAIERLPGGGWKLNGVMQPAVNGCIDVDLGFTPATNLIPLRRL